METVGEWLDAVEAGWPARHAASWDAVGLMVGARDWPVARVLVTLDVTSAVVDEAAEVDGTLLLAHHPLLLHGLERLTPDTAPGRVALHAATRRVAVAAAHTNLDVARDGAGTSDPVARVLDLRGTAPLSREAGTPAEVKLVTFVPRDAVAAVLDALAAAGAGSIGEYERCAFLVDGTGTFRPVGGADPAVGEVGRVNEVAEARVEMVLPRGRVEGVVGALRRAHPYEEVAFDLYPLEAERTHGFGVLGTLPEPLPLREVARRLRDGLPAPHLRFGGDPEATVRTVAAVGGAGGSLADAARRAGADVFVTGDLKHHQTLDQLELGMAMVDAGHHGTEHPAMAPWIGRLRQLGTERGLLAPVLPSATDTTPWQS